MISGKRKLFELFKDKKREDKEVTINESTCSLY